MAQNDQTTYTEIRDEELIDKIIKGEASLYEPIIRKYNPYLYKIGRSYNFNHEDAEDLMQDTYIDAYKNLASFEGRSSFKTWIVRIMLNNCYRRKRKASYKNEYNTDLNENSIPMFTPQNNDTEKIVQKNELSRIIEDALSKIPLDYRMTFSLREMNGMSVKETAQLLNISESNVKVRLNRSKKMLQEIISKSHVNTELYEFNLIYCDGIVNRVMNHIKNEKIQPN